MTIKNCEKKTFSSAPLPQNNDKESEISGGLSDLSNYTSYSARHMYYIL